MGISNAYLVEVEEGLILIDTGTGGGYSRVLDYLASIGRKPDDVRYIILTHADGDHSGSAARLRRATGARLAVHELDAPRVAGEKKLKEVGGLGGLLVALFGVLMKVERVKPDIPLRDGDAVGGLAVIHTPGHTDGSICVHKPGDAIFVGDLLRTDGAGNLKLASTSMSRDMDEVRRSVERISKLEFSMLLPGHGEPVEEGASDRLREFVGRGFR